MGDPSKLDRLARDIFWARQPSRARTGKSKTAAWQALTAEAREGYRDVARNFAFLTRRLPAATLAIATQLGATT